MGIVFNPFTGNLDFTGSGSGGSTRIIKGDVVAGSSFAGSPKKFTVSFATPMPSTSYLINLDSTDGRDFTYESKTTAGFVINANANTAIGGEVSWLATLVGETT